MSKAIKSIGVGAALIGLSFIPGLGQLAAKFLLSAGLSFVTGGLSMALAPKPKAPRPRFDVQYDGTLEPRRILYGQLKVSGMHTIPAWTSGDGNKFLHQVLTIAGHQCEDITDVYFNQDVIADADIGSITGALTDGQVGGSGTYAGKAWIRRYLGTSGQAADYILDTAFTAWTSNHRGRGNTYIALQFEVDEDVYKAGVPQVSCIAKGKICYDARLDSSPGNDPTNATYRVYTTNPANILADYLIDTDVGCKVPSAKIDWDLVVAAANICDEDVLIPPASPTTEQKRYTCNVMLEEAANEAERRANIAILVGAMMGSFGFRGGKYRMYAGAAASSAFTLTESDLVGPVSMPTEIPAERKYNYVSGRFLDAARNYQQLPFEPRSNSAYETNDGGRKPREVEYPACTSQYEAQRNAIITLKRSRRKLEITGTWGMSAYRIRPGDVGTITLAEWGLSSQLVRCQTWKVLPNFTIEASFIEELASDWDDPAVGDYTVPTSSAGPTSGDFIPAPVVGFTATPVQDGILFQWEPPPNATIGTLYTIYEYTSATPFSSATPVASNLTGTSRTVIKADTTTRYYWITAKARLAGTESQESPSGNGFAAAALAITTGFRATVDRGSHHRFLVGTGSGNTNNTSTVTPINGVSPYTYSWVRQSGSTKISVISSTSQTTGFSASGLADQENVNAIFRCTVTDSTGGTPLTTTVDVSVSFTRDDSFGS